MNKLAKQPSAMKVWEMLGWETAVGRENRRMYPTKVFGGYGKISTPIEGAWGHYTLGVYHEKEEASTPFMILSNGVIERNQSADARFSGNLGRVTIPAVPILPEIEMKELAGTAKTTRDQIDAFLDKMNRPEDTLIHSTHEYMSMNFMETGETPGGNPTVQDFMVQTWPKLQQRGLTGFKDLYYRYFIARKPYLLELVNDLQAEITDIVRTVKGAPIFAKVGYGLFSREKTGLKLVRRPSRYTRFNVNTARLDITIDPFANTPLRLQAAYVWILAQQMKKMMTLKFHDTGKAGPGIEHFTDADYCAMANSYLLQSSGSGDIKIEKTYTASDISDQVLHMIGQNIAEAYPFLPVEDDAWEELIEWWLVSGIIVNRAKATTLMGEINLHSARNGIRAPYDFERYTKPNIENFGSLGTPFYFMSRNQIQGDFMLPCVMRYDDADKNFGIAGDAMDEPNIYDILMQKNPIKFVTADVTRGEVSGGVLDPLTEDAYVKLNFHPDGRIWDIEHSMQAIRMYRFPAFTVMKADGMTDALRTQLFILNQFANGKQNLKDGYFMSPGLGLFKVGIVKTFSNNVGLELVVKKDTRSTGEQMSSPNTVIPGKSEKVNPPESVKSTPAGPMMGTEKEGVIGESKSDQQAMTEATGA